MSNKMESWSWSNLPEELLEIIGKFLITKIDVSRFRALCKSWQSSIPPFKNPMPIPRTLKFKSFYLNEPDSDVIVTETILFHVAPSNSSSSSWGWLLKLQETKHGGFLVLNSSDFRVSELSKSYTLRNNKRRVFSSSSVDCSSMVQVRDFHALFHMKHDSYWVFKSGYECADFISYAGKFCMVHKDGRALTFDSCLKEKIEIASPLSIQRSENDHKLINGHGHDHLSHGKHLVVDLEGELLLVDVCLSANDVSLDVKIKSMGQIMKSRSDNDLPAELLEIIGKFLNTKTDVSRFRAVCKSWRSSIPPIENPVPLSLSFRSKLGVNLNLPVTETILYHVAPNKTDPNDDNDDNNSSSWGWLLNLQETGQHGGIIVPVDPNSDSYYNICSTFPKVLNPLDFRTSELFKSYKIDNYKFRVFFPSTSSLDCPNSVVLVYDFQVEFYMKHVDDRHWDFTKTFECVDIVSYGGKFCLVENDGRALTFDYWLKERKQIASSISSIQLCDVHGDDHHDHSDHEKHLVVDLDGELLLVDICVCRDNIKLSKKHKKLKLNFVKVFKLKPKKNKWIEVKSLEGRILFVGFRFSSFSVFARDFPGCKGDCACVHYNIHDKAAVFDLITGCFLPSEDSDCFTNIFLPPWSRSNRSKPRRDFDGQQLLITDFFQRKEDLLLST
ncbi:hypothetical protein FEM48_Zijuj10G0027300 [Ziziphus jujuba var. spinosa]|uniref:F-box domain-containing protein n=1 Tax=Ziziphus jujuba var. spinosa TaxID=714518 RepID=A0A978UKU6_ZIZJJ|nr:hypothetical protein FEM48_Zijuj10G0027300 [Ziziphus jujuba var. spinosa]